MQPPEERRGLCNARMAVEVGPLLEPPLQACVSEPDFPVTCLMQETVKSPHVCSVSSSVGCPQRAPSSPPTCSALLLKNLAITLLQIGKL